ncbi:DUF5686 family protein [candidate division KSB1 bacterium]
MINKKSEKISAGFILILLITALIPGSNTVHSQENVKYIVKRVQENSAKMHDYIKSISFKGKSKRYFSFAANSIDMNFVPEMEEYYFEGLWIRPDSLRIKIKALRKIKTPNNLFFYESKTKEPDYLVKIDKSIPVPNPIQFSYDLSLLGVHEGTRRTKEGKSIKYWPVFPFAAGADSLYNYEYIANVSLNGRRVFYIYVTPRFNDLPAVSGTFQIDEYEYNVVGSNIVFNEAAGLLNPDNETRFKSIASYSIIPIAVDEDHRIKSKYVLYHTFCWLPESIDEELFAMIMGVKIKMYRKLEFYSYEINPVTDERDPNINKKIIYDIDPQLEKELFKGLDNPHALTREEEAEILKSLEESAAKKDVYSNIFDMESLAKEVYKGELKEHNSKLFRIKEVIGDNFLYNRIEGLQISYGKSFVNTFFNNLTFSARAGYGFKDRRPKIESGFIYFFTPSTKKFFAEASIYNTITFNENKQLFSNGKNTFSSLVYKTDYRDYYYVKGYNIGLGMKPDNNFAVKLSLINQIQESAYNHTRFSIFRNSSPFRTNPEIKEGQLKAVRLLTQFKNNHLNLGIKVEYTAKNILNSDFEYMYIKASSDYSFNTHPLGEIYLSFNAGTSNGSLPPQLWFDFGGKSLFNYSGMLRGTKFKEYTGDRMLNGTIEYSLYGGNIFRYSSNRSIFSKIKRMTKLYFWAGFGWSKLSQKNISYAAGINTPIRTTDGMYSEFGFGISDRFNILRLDFIKNTVSKNAILFTVNVFR